MMGTLKDKYQQFRRWQEAPFEYQDSHEHHRCSNCGAESDNNYCPRCGQKAVYGPVTWRSVWRGFMDVWGVGSRSLPFTLWQLLWRPGYLMRDYISGKRQVSFPPVKMLVIIGVVAVLVDKWLSPDTQLGAAHITSTGLEYYWDVIGSWLDNHVEWAVLVAFCYLIIPVWILFREAPRYQHHSLPQGFFIQVFASTQFLFLGALIIEPLFLALSVKDEVTVISMLFLLILPCMLLINYKQLFGYGWWGTLWRVLMTIPFGALIFRLLYMIINATDSVINHGGITLDFWQHLMVIADVVMFMWLLAELVGVVNRKSWRERGRRALKRPLLLAVVSLLTGLGCYWLGVVGAFVGLVRSYLRMLN